MATGKRTSYFYAIFGITLVLVVLGLALAVLVEARRVSKELRENLRVQVVLKDSLDNQNIATLQAAIKGRPYVKNIKFVSKDDALKILREHNKIDTIDVAFLGYNPLFASFDLNLYEAYSTSQAYDTITKSLLALEGVEQVNFQKNELDSFNRIMDKASIGGLVVGALLLVFAVSLIFNTIRLAMFSNRFTIKSMQLFGATRWFIIKPFLGRSLFNGFLSGLIACIVLLIVIWYADYTIPELALQSDLITFALLFGALVLFGILISFFSTLTAIFRYLRVKVEDLY
ncbi:MAG: permease-like cell division protein FtsX [Chitinophagales bacterium]